MAVPLAFGSTIRSSHNHGGWRCRLNLSMFLLTISVGSFGSVQSVLEFSAIKNKEELEDHIRHREGFLNRSVSYGFTRVCVLYPERL